LAWPTAKAEILEAFAARIIFSFIFASSLLGSSLHILSSSFRVSAFQLFSVFFPSAFQLFLPLLLSLFQHFSFFFPSPFQHFSFSAFSSHERPHPSRRFRYPPLPSPAAPAHVPYP
jgi:hypothetical protein